jgi:hypothetical protein
MLFLAIFVALLLIYFGLIDRWIKRHKVKPYKGLQPVFDIIGGLVDFIRIKF